MALLVHCTSNSYDEHMNKRKTLSEQLRDAILGAEISRYQISKETGIAQSDLSRFVNRQQGLSLDTIDRLADYLNLELTKRTPPRKGK